MAVIIGVYDLTMVGWSGCILMPEELIALMDSSEHRRLKAENDKLRELVCMMLRVAGVAEYATDSEWQVVTDYLRELGIEV